MSKIPCILFGNLLLFYDKTYVYPKNNSLMQYCYRTFQMFLSKFWRNCMLYLTYLGFPGGSDSKQSACKARDLGLIFGSGRSPGEGNGNLPQYSCLKNSMGRVTWWTSASLKLAGSFVYVGAQYINMNFLVLSFTSTTCQS